MDYKIPPQAIEAEQSILGCMLLDKQAINDAIQILNADDFYKPEHSEIFARVTDLFNRNKPVDIVTVSNSLKDKGIDLIYLANITSDVPTTANARYYAGIVKGKALRRQFIKAANDITMMAYEGDYDSVIDLKNDVMQKVDIEIKDSRKTESDISKIAMAVVNDLEERYRSNDDYKKQYGFDWLDRKTGGAHNTDLTILAARPSVGKTAFSLQVAQNMGVRGNNIVIFSLEMGKKQLVERMMSNTAKVDSQRMRYAKMLNDEEWKKLTIASTDLSDLSIHIFDDVYKIEEIRARCREMKNKNQLDFVIIDYLQLCDTIKKYSGPNERVSHISRQTKMLAKELNVPVWMLSQLTRANEHDNRRPKLIDLRDSGAIEQDADNVFFLHDETYGKYTEGEEPLAATPVEVIIAKQRNGDRDIFGEVKFYKKTQIFTDR